MNRLLAVVGLRRVVLAVASWSIRPWSEVRLPTVLIESVGRDVAGMIAVAGWIAALVALPTTLLWYAITSQWIVHPALRLGGVIAGIALDSSLFWFNWRLHLRHVFGGPGIIRKQIEGWPVEDRAEVRRILDDYEAGSREPRGGRFTLLRLLELSDHDLARLRDLVAVAERDWRDLAESRPHRLWLSTL